MGCCANWSWIQFSSEEKGSSIRTELTPEGGEKVQELKYFYWGSRLCEFIVLGSRDNKDNEDGKKPNSLHPFASVKFVIDENCSTIVTDKGATDIEEVPVPPSQDRGIRIENLDENGLEYFVAVEKEIVAKPTPSSADKNVIKLT